MEQGEIKSWNETEKIDRIWRAHVQRHVATPHGTSQNADKSVNAKTTPCVYYNKGSCIQKQSHEVFLQTHMLELWGERCQGLSSYSGGL